MKSLRLYLLNGLKYYIIEFEHITEYDAKAACSIHEDHKFSRSRSDQGHVKSVTPITPERAGGF